MKTQRLSLVLFLSLLQINSYSQSRQEVTTLMSQITKSIVGKGDNWYTKNITESGFNTDCSSFTFTAIMKQAIDDNVIGKTKSEYTNIIWKDFEFLYNNPENYKYGKIIAVALFFKTPLTYNLINDLDTPYEKTEFGPDLYITKPSICLELYISSDQLEV